MNERHFSPGVFVCGHVFQRGDLPLYIYDTSGYPTSPAVITFTLFMYPKAQGLKGCPIQIGPSDRTPVQADTGEYYVTGIAGEMGQPGDWFVRWHWQSTSQSQQIEDIFGFKVFDSSQYPQVNNGCNPCFQGCNCSRFGGSCGRCGQNPCGCSSTPQSW